jgi:hypothetical protein
VKEEVRKWSRMGTPKETYQGKKNTGKQATNNPRNVLIYPYVKKAKQKAELPKETVRQPG